MTDSFLFYDLETWGADHGRSRIAQFAAIRTDAELNETGEPVSFLVRPANDLLPSPAAALVTGLTPQRALAEGINEAEAFARIHEEMSQPRTCTLGYNSIRFDDEFIRHRRNISVRRSGDQASPARHGRGARGGPRSVAGPSPRPLTRAGRPPSRRLWPGRACSAPPQASAAARPPWRRPCGRART